jgi:hypothetical protein
MQHNFEGSDAGETFGHFFRISENYQHTPCWGMINIQRLAPLHMYEVTCVGMYIEHADRAAGTFSVLHTSIRLQTFRLLLTQPM